ncbi:MAG: hypothetical protein WAK95_06480 [Desulfobacterales bacterium]
MASTTTKTGSPVGLTAVIGCLALVTAIGFWVMERRIAATVRQETALFQDAINAIALANDREYEAAVELLRPLVAALQERGVPAQQLTALIDAYLLSIVNAAEPLEYARDFTDLLPALETKMPRYGWRMHQAGWYFFRTGDLAAARHYFEKAIADFDGLGDFRESADTYWAAALINIAQGQKDLAVANLETAETRNYRRYNKSIFIADRSAYQHDPWFIRLGMQYADFWPTMQAILKEFETNQAAQPR